MSTASNVGGAFQTLGSGLGAAGPIGAGVGAGFSLLGGLIGLGKQVKEKKREEERMRREEAEAQRQSAQGTVEEGNQRNQAADVAPQVPTPTGPQGVQMQQAGQTPIDTQQEGVLVADEDPRAQMGKQMIGQELQEGLVGGFGSVGYG